VTWSAAAPFVSAYLVLAALMFGSFINLAADRVPRGESVIRPGSHCRSCGRRLNAVDLLPVLGYVLRGGRCATCGKPIGLSAPVVEAVAGALVLVSIVWLGLWPGALVGIALDAAWGVAVVGVSAQRRRAQGVS
jgi:prepilin signal peptidase PulO-like enzyme (type II secretory pathway)